MPDTIAEGLLPLAQPIASLDNLAGNPRRGDVAAVAGSLRRFGQRKPIVARRDTREVIAGNHTLQAARELGWEQIAVVFVDDDEATAQAFALADNRTSDLGTYDDQLLADMIRSVGQADGELLSDTGWDSGSIDSLLARLVAEQSGGAAEEQRQEQARATLAERFLVPPFSVLDARQGYWQDRKRAWLALGIRSEEGRAHNLLKMSDTVLEAQSGQNTRTRQKNQSRPRTLSGGEDPAFYKKKTAYEAEHGPITTPDFEKILLESERKKAPNRSVPDSNSGNDPAYYWKKQEAERQAGRSLTNEEFEAEWYQADAYVGGTSIFDPVLCEVVYRWFCPPGGRVVDPFAGGSVRGVVAATLGLRYHGIELRGEQVEANREQAAALSAGWSGAVSWEQGDSAELLPQLAEPADLIFSCPPYYDLERYGDDPNDLSNAETYEQFRTLYSEIIARAAEALAEDRFACFVVGDIRGPGGLYRGFVPDTIRAFEEAGCAFYNDAILVTAVGSLALRAARIFSSRKMAKALADETPVLTPTGWAPIGDLAEGDKVIAGDGSATSVTGVFPQGVRPLWRVTFDDGCSVDADADHLWQIEVRDAEPCIMSTSDILSRWGDHPLDPRPRIPFCAPPAFAPRAAPPIDPYLLGLLLGDGGLSGNTPVLTCAEDEIVAQLPEMLPPGIVVKQRGIDFRLVGAGARRHANPLTVELRRLGMMGRRSYDKEVPGVLLWGSPAVRLATLQGLMDSDGTTGRVATAYSSASEQLANDVAFLARSLGARVSIAKRETTHRPTYKVSVHAGPCPFRLGRKAAIWHDFNDHRRRRMTRKMVSILPSQARSATCITVAHPSALFVVDNFVVTHNSHQNVLVFCKGDPARAVEACGPVEVADPAELFGGLAVVEDPAAPPLDEPGAA